MCYYFGSGRLTVLERWLPSAVTILDRFHCTYCVLELVYMYVSMYCTFVRTYLCPVMKTQHVATPRRIAAANSFVELNMVTLLLHLPAHLA